MRPIRREGKQVFGHCPWEAQERPLGEDETVHMLSDTGGIESYHTERKIACSCGCLAEPVGFCAECVKEQDIGTVCAKHFGSCDKCNKPICPRHCRVNKNQDGKNTRFCIECSEAINRKEIVHGLGRFFLSPFIKFEK